MKSLYIVLLVAAALGGCGDRWSPDCSGQMEDLQDERGEPEEIRRFDVGRYHEHTWWYGRSGFARTFTWDESTGSCTTSDQTFEPIPS